MRPDDYEYLEHTADLRFRSYGATLGECFANAARAMYAAVIDPSSVDVRLERRVAISARNLQTLLHDWLSDALLFFETENLVFRDFSVYVAEQSGGYTLSAVLAGQEFDPGNQTILMDIKAVTYHELYVKKENGRWVAEVLCDV